jgi:hypothetical protein
MTYHGLTTTRADGTVLSRAGSGVTLGDIPAGEARSALWSFRATSLGLKTLTFYSHSDNRGSRVQSIDIDPCEDDSFETMGAGATDDQCYGAQIDIPGSQTHAHCDEDSVLWFPAARRRTSPCWSEPIYTPG